MPQQSSGQLQNQFPAAAAPSLFPSGESVGSLSYLSEGRSLAHNKATEVWAISPAEMLFRMLLCYICLYIYDACTTGVLI